MISTGWVFPYKAVYRPSDDDPTLKGSKEFIGSSIEGLAVVESLRTDRILFRDNFGNQHWVPSRDVYRIEEARV